ncbi:Ferric reductase transmembrane component 5 [Fusarium oxysporum f. sp. albedinis]|nr:Ferric reductase transmembrane component 5 [Fusarium oxysporum f. sp. albedinis]
MCFRPRPRARRRSTRTSQSLSFSPCYLGLLGSIRRGDPPKNNSPHLFPESPQLHATLCKLKALLDLTCKDPATESEIKPYRPSFNAGKKHASFVSGAIHELATDCHSTTNVPEKILR